MPEKEKKYKDILRFLALSLALIFLSLLPRLLYSAGMDGFRADPSTLSRRFTNPDSYYYLRMSRWKSGEDVGIVATDDLLGEYLDTKRYAAEGFSFGKEPLLLSELTALTFRAFSFVPGFSLYDAAWLLNILLPPLVLIPLLFFLRSILRDLDLADGLAPAALVAAVLTGLNSLFLQRTLPGYYDTDLLIPFFFTLQLYLLFLVLTGTRPLLCAALLSLVTALFSRWWSGNTFYVVVCLGILLAGALFEASRPLLAGLSPASGDVGRDIERSTRFSIVRRFLFCAAALPLGLFLSGGPAVFRSALERIGIIFRLRADTSFRAGEEWFPNAYISIQEMRQSSLSAGGFAGLFQSVVLSGESAGMINYAGGICVCLAAAAGLLYLPHRLRKDPASRKTSYILLTLLLWCGATLIASLRAVRYQMLLAVPFALLAGIFTAEVSVRLLRRERLDRVLVLLILFTALLFPTLFGAFRTALRQRSSFPSEDMAQGALLLQKETPENAVVASWWDYGYFYTEAADRATLFDGGSQSGIRLYWMARAFATNGQRLTANILRMLAGSGDAATRLLLEKYGDGDKVVRLMLPLLRTDRERARGILMEDNGFTGEEADALLSLTHPENVPPVILAVSSDMIGKHGWFSRFGGWKGTRGSGSTDYKLTADKLFLRELKEGENVFTLKNVEDKDLTLMVTATGAGDALTLRASCTDDADGAAFCRFRRIYYDTGERQYLFEPAQDAPPASDADSPAGVSGPASSDALRECDLMLVPAGDRLRVIIAGPALSDSICGELYLRNGKWQDRFVRLDDPEVPPFTLPVSLWMLKEE